jgi:hypothetical protein
MIFSVTCPQKEKSHGYVRGFFFYAKLFMLCHGFVKWQRQELLKIW